MSHSLNETEIGLIHSDLSLLFSLSFSVCSVWFLLTLSLLLYASGRSQVAS